VIAVVVGGIETLGLCVEHFQLKGWFWSAILKLNGNFGSLGYFIVGLFVLSWVVSIAVYRWRKFDELEMSVLSETS